MLFTFYRYLTFLLSRCRWIYLWSCWEGLIVAALERRFSNFYVCTKVFFFDIHEIALFAHFITQVDLHLLRWSLMVPERTKKSFFCRLYLMFYVQCRLRVETYLAKWSQFCVIWGLYMQFRCACSRQLCAWGTDLPCKDPNGDFVFRGPLMLRDTVQICGVHQ